MCFMLFRIVFLRLVPPQKAIMSAKQCGPLAWDEAKKRVHFEHIAVNQLNIYKYIFAPCSKLFGRTKKGIDSRFEVMDF